MRHIRGNVTSVKMNEYCMAVQGDGQQRAHASLVHLFGDRGGGLGGGGLDGGGLNETHSRQCHISEDE